MGAGRLARTRANLRSLINFSASAGEIDKAPRQRGANIYSQHCEYFNKASRSRVRICGYATEKGVFFRAQNVKIIVDFLIYAI